MTGTLPPRDRPVTPDLTAGEIKTLWAEHGHRPEGEIVTVTLRDGRPWPVLIGWLRYAHEYVQQLERA